MDYEIKEGMTQIRIYFDTGADVYKQEVLTTFTDVPELVDGVVYSEVGIGRVVYGSEGPVKVDFGHSAPVKVEVNTEDFTTVDVYDVLGNMSTFPTV